MHVQISVVTAMKNSSQWVLEQQPKKLIEADVKCPSQDTTRPAEAALMGRRSSGHSTQVGYLGRGYKVKTQTELMQRNMALLTLR